MSDSESESHFQAFNRLLRGRLEKRNPSTSPQPTGVSNQLEDDKFPSEDEEPPSEDEESPSGDEESPSEDGGSLSEDEGSPSEETTSRRERWWPVDKVDDNIPLIPIKWKRSKVIYVGHSVDPDTGSTSLSCTILEPGLEGIIKQLKYPVAYRLPRESDEARSHAHRQSYGDEMVIDAPFHDLYFARAELKRRINKEEARFSRKMSVLLDFINGYFENIKPELRRLKREGAITHRLLWTMFPSGTLVYVRQPTLLRGLAYEQCIVVQSTSYIQAHQRKGLSIFAGEWRFTGFSYHQTASIAYIPEFQGDKTISAETLTHLPFASLSEDLRNGIKTRLIERAKRYLDVFARPASVWEYEGPATLLSKDDTISILTDALETPETFPGNRLVKERVVVESRLMGEHYGYLLEKRASVPTLDHSKPIDEETYLTCSGYVSASLIDTEFEATRLILSHLRPVRWEPNTLHGAEVAHKDTILNQVKEFSLENQMLKPIVGERRQNAGLVFWLKGPLLKNKSFARNIAESAEKPFVQKDLLRFLGGEWENGPVVGISTSLKRTINWQCVIFLENCGKLMERRLIDEPERAYEITRFFDMLNFHPGIIFLSPGIVNESDPLFDELSVVVV